MKAFRNLILLLCFMQIPFSGMGQQENVRDRIPFTDNWRFFLGDEENAFRNEMDDSFWQLLDLPHDWSIEGEFRESHPATVGGGALPGGIGWYRKTFHLPASDKGKIVFIDFDGIYQNSKVWINGHFLGERPNGYISFRYDLTPWLHYGKEANVIAVRVDNSRQPNSRWYSGSGIYRNVWLVKTSAIHIPNWGTFITTPEVSREQTQINMLITVENRIRDGVDIDLVTNLLDPEENVVAQLRDRLHLEGGQTLEIQQTAQISDPELWSTDTPVLYKAVTEIYYDSKKVDEYATPFGIRYFEFDAKSGFSLNGQPMKIKGVCNHHDLGCLGSAINARAIERQLDILKEMGCNAIRTAHNPPAPELLDLCDRKGFLVMDEAFDMWKKNKTPFDYGNYWDEWHERDLKDFMLRDRNHPCIIIWSIGNEILEQWDTEGERMVMDLYHMARSIDTTRPITTANNPPSMDNHLTKPMVVDLIGFNYAHEQYEDFPSNFPGQKFIATETNSALATRGHYDMPSDSVKRWPVRWDLPFTGGNPDNTVSAYDHVSAPWGSTHEETWKIIKKHDHLSGMFIWTGFDYLGEPTPYTWPSRSSYFGIVDLAGFPKDSYYLYKSEWTEEPVLHIFPHWNWNEGDTVDVWAYFNCDEAELFLNGESMGTKRKAGDELHVMWRLAYQPGELLAVGRSGGIEILTQRIHTAGEPAKIRARADRSILSSACRDLAFITIEILDEQGNLVPHADNLVTFSVEGDARIAAVDNGSQTSHESFRADHRKAFNGKCLVVIGAGDTPGKVIVRAASEGLSGDVVELFVE